MPHFSIAAPIFSGTNMLLTVPSVAMLDASVAYGLARRDLPFEMPPLKLSLFTVQSTGMNRISGGSGPVSPMQPEH